MKRKAMYVIGGIFLAPIVGILIVAQIEFSSPKLTNIATSAISEAIGIPVHIGSLSVKLAGKVQASDIHIGEEGKGHFSAGSLVCRANPLKFLVKSPVLYAELKEGEINLSAREEECLKVDSIEIDISSKGRNEPIKVDVKGEAFHKSINFSAKGQLLPGDRNHIDLDISLDAELKNIAGIAKSMGIEIPPFTGTGSSKLNVSLAGSPSKLEVTASADLTENEIIFRDLFKKEKGLPLSLKVNSAYEEGKLDLSDAELKIGSGTIHLSGEIKENGGLQLDAKTDDLDIHALAQCIPAVGKREVSGKAAFDLALTRQPNASPAISGRLTIEEWRLDTFCGQSLECSLKPRDGGIEIDKIEAVIGKGKLTGRGVIEQDGKFHFNLKGKDLDMKKFLAIKKGQETALEMTGMAHLEASLSGTEEGPQGLNGSGQLSIRNGKIITFSWIKELLKLINLPELMPFNYENINGAFKITGGKVNLQTLSVEGKDALFYVKKGTIDLVKRQKEVTADFALAPHLVKRERAKFKEFDKFFSVDSNGYAHLTAVWDGPLSKTSPNIAASLISTFGKKLLEKLLR